MTIHSVVIQKLLSTNAQLGRRVAAHHFKIYTYGMRNKVAIIDSDKTLICMRSACNFIGSLARQKGRFMFVNTNPLFDEIFEQMMKKIGCYSPSANALWRTGGFLTNSFSPKKFRSRNKKISFGPTQPPDCVVIVDTERKSSVIKEADKLQIPIVALVDSSMSLDSYKRISYPIPANDSVQFIYLFCNLLTKTLLLEQKLARTENELSTSTEAESRYYMALWLFSLSYATYNCVLSVVTLNFLVGMLLIWVKRKAKRIKAKKRKNDLAKDEVTVVPYADLVSVSEGKVYTDSFAFCLLYRCNYL